MSAQGRLKRRTPAENAGSCGATRGPRVCCLHQADLLDQLSLANLIRDVRPQEVDNRAARSFVPTRSVRAWAGKGEIGSCCA
jgi:GDP-D-mannose dehydratase